MDEKTGKFSIYESPGLRFNYTIEPPDRLVIEEKGPQNDGCSYMEMLGLARKAQAAGYEVDLIRENKPQTRGLHPVDAGNFMKDLNLGGYAQFLLRYNSWR